MTPFTAITTLTSGSIIIAFREDRALDRYVGLVVSMARQMNEIVFTEWMRTFQVHTEHFVRLQIV